MGDTVNEVTLTAPSGKTRTLALTEAHPGVWRSTIEANELGLWRASDGSLTALANVGPANPREFTEVTSTTQVLEPLVHATGGDAVRIESGNGIHLPRILGVRSNDTFKGDDWLGLRIREASVVRGIGVLPIFAGLIGLLLLIGSLATACRAGIGLAGSSRSSIRKAKRLTKSPSLTFEQQRVYFPNTSCAAASRLAFGFSVQNDTSCSAFVFSTSTSTTVGSSSSV